MGNFKNFMKYVKPEDLRTMVAQPNAAGISGYREYVKNYFLEHQQEQVQQNNGVNHEAPAVPGTKSKKTEQNIPKTKIKK